MLTMSLFLTSNSDPLLLRWQDITKKIVKDELRFLVFMDYGYGSNHEIFPGEVNHNNLMGVGPGIRYNLPPYLTFRGDLGYKVWQPVQSDNHTRWRFEFGLVASY
jgi:hemolysin activation/secretion protein